MQLDESLISIFIERAIYLKLTIEYILNKTGIDGCVQVVLDMTHRNKQGLQGLLIFMAICLVNVLFTISGSV